MAKPEILHVATAVSVNSLIFFLCLDEKMLFSVLCSAD